MKRSNILIINNDLKISEHICSLLKDEGCNITIFNNVKDSYENILNLKYDLYIINISLPDYNGFYLCQMIRKDYLTPIVMISNTNDESDVVRAFGCGVDEFIVIPFRDNEFKARTLSLIKKFKLRQVDVLLEVNGIIINKKENTAFLNNQELSLTPTEFKLLKILMENAGRVISSRELLNSV